MSVKTHINAAIAKLRASKTVAADASLKAAVEDLYRALTELQREVEELKTNQ
ncbi:MAG: hypothetical protein LBR58_01470 [Propionibacteriaceae bacterium]|jgi:hypothetical protein|nr:hypothetical protein [Propionibacteriaceae bacterium]